MKVHFRTIVLASVYVLNCSMEVLPAQSESEIAFITKAFMNQERTFLNVNEIIKVQFQF